MREIKYYCDVCKKQFDPYGIYYKSSVCSDRGIIAQPNPSNIEICSIECAIKWWNKLLIPNPENEIKRED